MIRDSQTSADRLIRASRELEHIVYGVSRDDSSLAATEYDITEARTSLEQHQLMRASRSVRRAEKALSLGRRCSRPAKEHCYAKSPAQRKLSLKQRLRLFYAVYEMLLVPLKSVKSAMLPKKLSN